jgi:hypothetical protein
MENTPQPPKETPANAEPQNQKPTLIDKIANKWQKRDRRKFYNRIVYNKLVWEKILGKGKLPDRREEDLTHLIKENYKYLEKFCELACPQYYEKAGTREIYFLVKESSISKIKFSKQYTKLKKFLSDKNSSYVPEEKIDNLIEMFEGNISNTDPRYEASDLIHKSTGIEIPPIAFIPNKFYVSILDYLVRGKYIREYDSFN